jgi:hypothetical protein
MAGTCGKPVVEKLGIKPGFSIFCVGAPAAYADIVGRLPAGVAMSSFAKAPLRHGASGRDRAERDGGQAARQSQGNRAAA